MVIKKPQSCWYTKQISVHYEQNVHLASARKHSSPHVEVLSQLHGSALKLPLVQQSSSLRQAQLSFYPAHQCLKLLEHINEH